MNFGANFLRNQKKKFCGIVNNSEEAEGFINLGITLKSQNVLKSKYCFLTKAWEFCKILEVKLI